MLLKSQIVRRLNSMLLCLIVILCILLIYVSNRFRQIASVPPDKFIRTNHIEQHSQSRFVDGSTTFGPTTTPTTTYNNETARIENIVNAQRLRIASEMKDFNYTSEMIGLSALTPETNGQPLRSVIFSTWRSGTSFLGDIVNAIPGNYYHYEPLAYHEIVQIRGPPESTEAVATLKSMLKCNYTGLEPYLEYGKKVDFMFNHNSRLWTYCDHNAKSCYDPNFLNPFCRLFPFQSMKVVRMRVKFSEPLLIDPLLNVKIVLLIRDPRATMQSRRLLEWCRINSNCGDPANFCKDMVSDYKAAEVLTKKYPQRFKAIRYEDLSLNPYKGAEKILNYFGLPFGATVEQFLNSHTRTDSGTASSTFRNSKKAPFHWMRDLSFHDIDQIQQNCTEAMSLWGYKKVDNENALKGNTTFNPLLEFPFS